MLYDAPLCGKKGRDRDLPIKAEGLDLSHFPGFTAVTGNEGGTRYG